VPGALEKMAIMVERLMIEDGDAATARRVIQLAADIARERDLSGELEIRAAAEARAAGRLHQCHLPTVVGIGLGLRHTLCNPLHGAQRKVQARGLD
jgi:hypothetical protein